MRTLILIRHAESKWVETADASPVPLFGGRMNDVPLSVAGRRQAGALGRAMRQNGIRPTKYVSSPALRAVQTFEGVQRGLMHAGGMDPLVQITELQELSWGDWEGKPRSIADKSPWAEQRRSKGFGFCPPGGESYKMVRTRAFQGLSKAIRGTGHNALIYVFTHQNVIKSLVYPWLSWNIDQTMRAKLHVTGLTTLRVHGSVGFRLVSFDRQAFDTC